ncbi:MAG: IS630 family transposase, partial [Methanoregulaceae archaeon]|nr:IS630 family transposase [Methanoregulaceae archaeon]
MQHFRGQVADHGMQGIQDGRDEIIQLLNQKSRREYLAVEFLAVFVNELMVSPVRGRGEAQKFLLLHDHCLQGCIEIAQEIFIDNGPDVLCHELEKIHELVQCHKRREIDLYFFDEAGFSLVPTVPYAWQRIGERLEIPSRRSKHLNVLGFLGIDQRFWCNTIEGCVDSWCVVGCIDEFCKTLVNPTVVVMDNASVHKSSLFEAKISQWADQGLFFYFLPPYSPELNLIERLWRMIKYHWLPTSALDE